MSIKSERQKKYSHPDSYLLDKYIEGCANKDSAALSNLYEAVSSPVFAFALSLLKNQQDAEDVLHDCLINVWETAGKYKSSGKPMAWIMTICRNLSLNLLKDRSRSADIAPEDWERCLQAAEHASSEDKLFLRACMLRLSDAERRVLVLHAVSGFKHRDIAEFLDMPLPTVLSKYSRAVKKLKNIWEKETVI